MPDAVPVALIEHLISSETIASGGMLTVKRDQVRVPNGSVSQREYVIHPGAVVVVPMLPNGNVILEKQFRYALNSVFIELPAGKIDTGEAILVTGQRGVGVPCRCERGDGELLQRRRWRFAEHRAHVHQPEAARRAARDEARHRRPATQAAQRAWHHGFHAPGTKPATRWPAEQGAVPVHPAKREGR